MLISDTVKEVMKVTRTTQTRLAELMGYKSQGTVGNALKARLSAEMLVQWLDKLGYEVVVQPKTSGKRREGSIVLEPSGLPDGRGKKQKKAENSEAPAEE